MDISPLVSDAQYGITACLEEGTCIVNGVSVLQEQGFEP